MELKEKLQDQFPSGPLLSCPFYGSTTIKSEKMKLTKEEFQSINGETPLKMMIELFSRF